MFLTLWSTLGLLPTVSWIAVSAAVREDLGSMETSISAVELIEQYKKKVQKEWAILVRLGGGKSLEGSQDCLYSITKATTLC